MNFGIDFFLRDDGHQLLDALLDGVTIYDRDATLIWANKKACEILGVLREDILGLNISEIATLPTVETIQTTEFGANANTINDVRSNRRGLRSYASPGYMVFKNGTRMLYTGGFISDSSGDLQYAVYTIRDSTALEDARCRIRELEKLTYLYRDQLEVMHSAKIPHNIAYAGPCMRGILDRATKLARMECTVLITGETGVGKNLLASYLHRASPRAQGPFIHVNCACLPESLVEAELFGYAEGSFTGATRKGHRGLIEIADGGTLFLDEIAEISPSMQAKLLSVIEDRAVRRIGSERWRKINVRFVAATNKAPEDLRAGRGLRADLYYRLAMGTIHIPPLRERPDDIAPLVNFALAEFNDTSGTNLSLHPALLDAFAALPVPGNAREIKNLVWQIAVEYTPDSDPLMQVTIPPEAARLLQDFDSSTSSTVLTAAAQNLPINQAGSEQASEAIRLRSLAERCDGDIYQMASLLNVHRTTVIRKLKRHGISYARRHSKLLHL